MDDRTRIEHEVTSSLAYLFWTNGRERGGYVRLNPAGTTFGSGPRADARLSDADASDEHCRVRREGDEWFIYDLAGADTTKVDDRPIYRSALADRTRISIGRSTAVFRTLE